MTAVGVMVMNSTIGQINPDAPEAIRNVNIRQGKTFNDIILESDDRLALMTAVGVMICNGNVDFVRRHLGHTAQEERCGANNRRNQPTRSRTTPAAS